MTLEYEFRYALPEELKAEAKEFFDSLEAATIEQYPGWYEVRKDPGVLCYFIARSNRRIVCFAQILEYRRPFFNRAMLHFGPLFKTTDALIDSLKAIHRYYAGQGFMYLSVQLAMPTGSHADLVEYSLNKELQIRYRFDKTNWSSLVIDLGRSMEEIYKGFADNHKGSIKKAQKAGLTTRVATTPEDIERLCSMYCAMKASRGLPVDREEVGGFYERLFRLFKETGKGFVLLVQDSRELPVGGLIIVIQGATARYFMGAADPGQRDVPILHLGMLEAIRLAQSLRCATFDFWGYNLFAEEGDQIFHINRFKKWFSGTPLFYPKTMHFHLRPARYAAFQMLSVVRDRLRSNAS